MPTLRIPPRRAAAAALALLLLAAGPAAAQFTFPRVGLSASATSYVDSLTAELGEEFTLYACVFGHDPGQPLDQPVQVVPWVVHQACCGATLDVVAVDLDPAFAHTGTSPLAGMVSTAPACVDEDGILLATLHVRILAPGPGRYLWAAGPYAFVQDCAGGQPIFMDMPVTIIVPGTTPGDAPAWGAVKARYR